MKNLITCLVVCMFSCTAFATTLTVDDDSKADFDNIQAAVDADEPQGGEREIMPCDLDRVTSNRGVMWGTLWPAGLVYYDFDASISQLNRNRTRAAMDLLETATEMGTVFIPRTNEPDYIHIIEDGGNWSYVGMQGGSQDLSMYNWSYPFIICHELIHALGRLHQQSRSDRDSYITVNWECIDTNYAHNYNICGQCPNYGEYDFESVMHYSQWGFNIGCPTMTCLPGYEEYQDVMGQRDYLSDGDIETLQFMYPLQSATGACCVGTAGGCIDNLSELDCLAGSGTWLGADSVCADGDCTECTDPCDPECDVYDPCVCDPESCSNGACCLNENCSIMTASDCAASGGSFLGDGSNCQANPCINGILNVPGDFPTIQAAVDAAIDGDEILVMPGTYMGIGEEVVNLLGKAVWVHSSDGPDVTIIDGESIRRVLLCNSEEDINTIIEGFTISNGSPSSGADAGGMWNFNTSPRVVNCRFINNTGTHGGAVRNHRDSPTFEDCIFENNTADYGGGMYNNDNNATPTLTNCIFKNNTANYNGGGMWNYISNPTLADCLFEGNVTSETTYADGGGMYNWESSPTLTNCTFENNLAFGGAGVANYTNSSPVLTNCLFENNAAVSWGGGSHNYDNSYPQFDYCIFSMNSADDGGGGLVSYVNSDVTLTNCVIQNNTSGILAYNASFTISNTTLCGNSEYQTSGGYTDNGGNTIEDECPIGCPDINGDGNVDVSDLLTIIDYWGQTDSPADVNEDGIVDVSDLLIVVGNWGPCQLDGAVQWTIEEGGNDHWYLVDWLPTEPTSWSDLNQHAISLGGHLVTILSAEENYFVINLMESLKENYGWIGFTSEANTNTWQWVTGEPVDFTSWGGSNCGAGPYPNNSGTAFRFVLLNNRYMDCGWNWDDFNPGHPLNYPVIVEWSN